MDNITHSLAGWALGQTGLKRKTRKGLAALILGANLPDIDVFLTWVSWVPLATHRGFTHSLVGGLVVLPPLLAALLYLLDRWQVRRGSKFSSGLSMHFGWLLALCYLGTLTHPLLDLQTVYAVQLFSPFDSRWHHSDTLFIIDLVLWVVLVSAVWLSRKRHRLGTNWQRPAILAVAIVLAYIGFNAAISQLAKQALRDNAAYTGHEIVVASPPPALFWQRDVIWRQGDRIGWAKFDPFRSLSEIYDLAPFITDNMDDPDVQRAKTANADIETFLRWSILPYATVRSDGCQNIVTFGDARYMDPRASGTFTRRVVLRENCSEISG